MLWKCLLYYFSKNYEYLYLYKLPVIESVSGKMLRRSSHRQTLPLNFSPSRSEEHTSELQSLTSISYAVFCLKKFFFNDTATTEIYTPLHTLSLHDALPISTIYGSHYLYYHLRPICRHIQCREPRRTVSHVVFDDTVYLPHRHDGKNPLRGIYMGADSIDDYPLRFCHWTGVGNL